MKFKGLTKIALAGAAVAVTAATLATSTYAWYVTNDTATVDGLTGSVAAVGGGNILVAQAKNGANGDLPGGFSTGFSITSTNVIAPWKVTLNSSTSKYTKESTGLIPVTPGTFAAEQNNNGTITPAALTADATLASWVNEKGQAITTPEWTDEDNATAGEVRYIEFKLWLMSTEDVSEATLKLNLHNTTQTLPTQQAYNDAGVAANTQGLKTGRTIALNALEAVRIAYTEDDTVFTAVANPTGNPSTSDYYEVVSNNYALSADTTVDANKTYYTKATNAANYNIFDAYAQAETKTADLTFDDSTGFDANEYYYAIMNQIPVGAAYTASISNNVRTDTITNYSIAAPSKKLPKKGAASSADQVTLSLTANVAKKLTFRVWLEGTDAQCFDCCTGQTFDFDLEFSK